jgi:hypothetical protein
VCKSPAHIFGKGGSAEVECFRCGNYRLTDEAKSMLKNPKIELNQKLNLSSYIYSNKGMEVNSRNLDVLLSVQEPRVYELAEMLLFALSEIYPRPGMDIKIVGTHLRRVCNSIDDQRGSIYNLSDGPTEYRDLKSYLPIMSASWTNSPKEVQFLLDDVLVDEKRFLTVIGRPGEVMTYRISGAGWSFLQHPTGLEKGDSIFVAMSFSEDMESAYEEIIKPGIELAGYKPVRIDKEDHVNRIDDEILARIRCSKLVVADFTQQKNGVYFEAGFALGIGIPVVWMCEKGDFENVHFDTRQYNTLVWENGKLNGGSKSLSNRIQAIVGMGSES